MRFHLSLALLAALGACDSGVSDKTDSDDVADETSDADDPSSDTEETSSDTEADTCPVLAVAPDALTFSSGEPNTSVSEGFTLTNDCDGTAVLAVSMAVSTDAFSLDADSIELAPGESAEVVVTFQASDFATYTDTVVIAGEAGAAEVSLVGTAGTDADGDGYAAEDSDCDDSDETINPAAEEIWYDGVDQDCDEASDYDQDGDGYDRDVDGGEDCDDEDAAVNPDASETQDLVDEDCDGLTDEDFLSEGDVFLTEVFSAPVSSGETDGQWVELYNASGTELELMGWTFSNEDDSWEIDSSLRVAAGAYAVLGGSTDTSANGGASVDLAWSSDIVLDDDDDTLTFTAGSLTISTMSFTDRWDREDGASLSLDDTFLDFEYADDSAYWCDATSELPDGDYGTPGGVNDNCTSVDHDGDGYSEDDGDCDEEDDAVYPDAPEVWDQADNDCDGLTDQLLEITDIAHGSLIGEEWTQGSEDGTDEIGIDDSLAIGDVDNDGDDDLIIGAPEADCLSGKVYILEAGDYSSWSEASIESESHTILYGWSNRNAWGVVPQQLHDVTGDGVVDVTVGGYGKDLTEFTDSYPKCSSFDLGPAQWATFEGGSSVSGDLFFTDGDVACSDDCEDDTQVLATLDMDGDSTAELYVGTTDTITVYQVDGLSGDIGEEDYAFSLTADTTYGDTLGARIHGADLDGDGYDDLLAGANGDDEAASNAGALYIVYGDSTLPSDQTIEDAYDIKLMGDASDDRLDPVARLGDVDGDGDDDLVLSDASAGGVFLFSDASSLTTGTMSLSDADLTLTGASHDDFGEWMELGDLDNDGQQDIVVAALGDLDNDGTLFWFPGVDLSSGTSFDSDDAAMSTVFGSSTTFPGVLQLADVSGDGVEDILVGDPEYDASGYGGILWVLEAP